MEWCAGGRWQKPRADLVAFAALEFFDDEFCSAGAPNEIIGANLDFLVSSDVFPGGCAERVDFPKGRVHEDEVIEQDRAAGLDSQFEFDHVAALLGHGFFGVEDFEVVFARLDKVGSGCGFG